MHFFKQLALLNQHHMLALNEMYLLIYAKFNIETFKTKQQTLSDLRLANDSYLVFKNVVWLLNNFGDDIVNILNLYIILLCTHLCLWINQISTIYQGALT